MRLAAAVLLMFLIARPAWAHGGGLDENRCHVETRTGKRHCHPDNDTTKSVLPPAEPMFSKAQVLVLSAAGIALCVGVFVLIDVLDGDEYFSMSVAPAPGGIVLTGTF